MPVDELPRLLVVSSTYPRWSGDPEPGFVHELARRLVGRFDVLVVAPHARGALRREILDGVRIHRYRYATDGLETLVQRGGILTNLRRSPWKWLLVPGFLLAQWWTVRGAVRRFRPAVLHLHWLLPQGAIGWLAAGRTPLVATSHGADLFGLKGPALARLRRAVLGRMKAVTVVSQAMRTRVLEESPDACVHVLPMGVDTDERFSPPTGPRTAGLLLFVGRLVEKKGLAHLIRALPAVRATSPHVRLAIVGFGPEEAALRELVAELRLQEVVSFEGARPQQQLRDFYRRAELFVAPFVESTDGDQEGLGLVVAEAMACGCPVLAGDVPAVHDLVGEGRGACVPAKNVALLAAEIVSLLQDPDRRRRLGETGRAHVVDHYGWPVVARAYGDLLAAAR